MKVVFIGAGNVATHLSTAMQEAGMTIIQIYNRNENNAAILANLLNTCWTSDINKIVADADLYIFCLRDDALVSVISQLPVKNGCWVHTAGSIPLHIFKGYTERYGVFYPLQTFSKNRKFDFTHVPFFIEANNNNDEKLLYAIAANLSTNVRVLSSEKRKFLHLAAVFACNFTNHMYMLADKILEEQDIPGDVLLPLIDETAAKIHSLSPYKAQTGPAIRYDLQVIQKHLDLINNPEMKEIYQILSSHIYKLHHHE